jgi:hypothetical protein
MTFIPVFVSQSDLGDPMGVNAHQGSTFRRGLMCKWECPLFSKLTFSPGQPNVRFAPIADIPHSKSIVAPKILPLAYLTTTVAFIFGCILQMIEYFPGFVKTTLFSLPCCCRPLSLEEPSALTTVTS